MKITIFWLAWSGTSTAWKLLAERLSYSFNSTWNIMRNWAFEMWMDLYEFEDKVAKKDLSFDKKLDLKVKDFWENNDDFIFESRLAWYFIEDSFKIYIACNEDIRYKRIFEREWWDFEDIVRKTKKRETEVIKRYKEVYPYISFPPEKQDFDLYIDSQFNSPEEIVEIIMKKIK